MHLQFLFHAPACSTKTVIKIFDVSANPSCCEDKNADVILKFQLAY